MGRISANIISKPPHPAELFKAPRAHCFQPLLKVLSAQRNVIALFTNYFFPNQVLYSKIKGYL